MPLPKHTAGYSDELKKLVNLAAMKFERGIDSFEFPLKSTAQATNLRFRFYNYRKALKIESGDHPDPGHMAECADLYATAQYIRMKIITDDDKVVVRIVNTKTDNDDALNEMGSALDAMFSEMRDDEPVEPETTEMGVEVPEDLTDLFSEE